MFESYREEPQQQAPEAQPVDEITERLQRVEALLTQLQQSPELRSKQEIKSVDPDKVIPILEQALIIQALQSKSTHSAIEVINHFKAKQKEQKHKLASFDPVGWLAWQVLRLLCFTAVAVVFFFLVVYVPGLWFCQAKNSPFCNQLRAVSRYFNGDMQQQRSPN